MNKLIYLLVLFPLVSLVGQNVGINTTSPQATLHVGGNFKFQPNTAVVASRMVGVSSTGNVKEYPLSDTFDIVDGTITVVEHVDTNVFLVGTFDQTPLAPTTSWYHDFDLNLDGVNELNTVIRITGETNGYGVSGFSDGYDGRVIYFNNAQNHNVTFTNLDPGSDPENQILTSSGANEGISNMGVAEFIYDAFLQKWIMVNIRS